ncbi:MAG: TerC family protein [Bryobacteraceae bacterium]|nr:TerC family protein [Bryobacteraceae bacterium]
MFEWLADPEAWIALGTLTALEIVLGIDNIVFISILAGKLPPDQQPRARQLGLLAALGSRLALLLSLSWIMGLTAPLFTVLNQEISGRDLILLAGGLFLIAKATREIHHRVEGAAETTHEAKADTFRGVIFQIMLIDVVFSLDSVITAVGMANQISIMVLAVVISVGIMMLSAGTISAFVGRHPTVKMLALSFLLLIGVALLGEGLALHIPKGYIYFAMAFSLGVEVLNIRSRRRQPLPEVTVAGS